MTAARAAAVDRMWKGVLREKGLPTDEAAVAEADGMWKEILKEKGMPLDHVYERLDKDTVPLKVRNLRDYEGWVYEQHKKLGKDGYKEMMKKKAELYGKFMTAKDVMNKMMLKKKAAKEEEVKKISEDQEGFGLSRCNNKKKKKEKKKNKRKLHGDDDDGNHKKKKMIIGY